jgi:hypothetical protein
MDTNKAPSHGVDRVSNDASTKACVEGGSRVRIVVAIDSRSLTFDPRVVE